MGNVVLWEKNGNVVRLALNAPPMNCISPEVLQELQNAIQKLREQKDVRAVVLCSNLPRIFCAGADVKQFLCWDKDRGEQMSSWGRNIFHQLSELPVPVVCAVNNGAYGGGLELALACDIRVFERNVRVALPECSLGVLPAYGGTQRLPKLIGKGHAGYMLYTGQTIDAEQAYEWGLCDVLADTGKATAEAMNIANKIAENSPRAVRAIKQCIQHAMALADTSVENQWFGALCNTPNKEEGVKAFLEKRKPVFDEAD